MLSLYSNGYNPVYLWLLLLLLGSNLKIFVDNVIPHSSFLSSCFSVGGLIFGFNKPNGFVLSKVSAEHVAFRPAIPSLGTMKQKGDHGFEGKQGCMLTSYQKIKQKIKSTNIMEQWGFYTRN